MLFAITVKWSIPTCIYSFYILLRKYTRTLVIQLQINCFKFLWIYNHQLRLLILFFLKIILYV